LWFIASMPEIAYTVGRVERSNERAHASLQPVDSARVPTVGPHHVGADCSFVDKYKAGGVKQALLADPASARPSHVGSLPLRRLQTFLTVMPRRARNRESALRPGEIRRFRSAKTISSSVRSGCSRMRASIRSEYFSNGDLLPPRGIGSEVPSSRKRCTHLIAELT